MESNRPHRQQVNFCAPRSLICHARAVAKENGLTVSEFIRQAITHHIDGYVTQKLLSSPTQAVSATF